MIFVINPLKLREMSRLSQQEVAGVSQNTYSRWESDLSTFKIEYLLKLTNVLK